MPCTELSLLRHRYTNGRRHTDLPSTRLYLKVYSNKDAVTISQKLVELINLDNQNSYIDNKNSYLDNQIITLIILRKSRWREQQ